MSKQAKKTSKKTTSKRVTFDEKLSKAGAQVAPLTEKQYEKMLDEGTVNYVRLDDRGFSKAELEAYRAKRKEIRDRWLAKRRAAGLTAKGAVATGDAIAIGESATKTTKKKAAKKKTARSKRAS